ncbi:MAG: ROK family protein [Magnetospirillum sp. WYHS-4]
MRIGIDLGGTKIEGIALDGAGRELARRRIATPRDDYAATVGAVCDLVLGVEREAGCVPGSASVGVGIPGTVSPATGLVKNANSTWLIGKPLDRDLAAILGRPVRLANDANCFAVSEAADGAGAGKPVVFGVILGTGVGGGVVVDGRPLVGANAIAGEWGHNPLPWPRDEERPGLPCYCGRKGCIETFLSGPGLERDHGGGLSAAGIARAGDAAAEAALARYEDRLARALATVINLIDPDAIVLGGGLSNLDRLYETVPRLWQDWVFSDRADTPLLRNLHGDSSGVRGAAWLWPA